MSNLTLIEAGGLGVLDAGQEVGDDCSKVRARRAVLLGQVPLCEGVNLLGTNALPILNALGEHVERLGELVACALEAQVFRRRH